ncbi:hypothetical protein Gasu2_56120 [Galdieria sulphuraria]|uniref:Uncharacterized protein n=1 Tax=Galdieria sulphuraria TaxID=130081 RepID=M2XRG2_GALSU|nr:uncharacterized protein Gasu_60970 [Galdieria sulphuraria]EME26253.1 hypothetical protein Gasu_60970 [Galdieria sulphuraria]GJD11477.1 hypothetical protein Gasu2_56120 [Galdieria sulphuraria]|eukprot:XP_005702773.1 hypothetical protein Gasu_60970 [Galdieria sulphuraria]
MDRHLLWRQIRRSLAQSPVSSGLLAIFAGTTLYFGIDTFYKRVAGELDEPIQQRKEFYRMKREKTRQKLEALGVYTDETEENDRNKVL